VIVRVADLLFCPSVAVTVAVVLVPTLMVFTVKVTEVFPASTVTLAGVLALGDPLVRRITTPPVGAAPVRVTVPVELLPPKTEVGLSVRRITVGGITFRLAVAVTPFEVASMGQLV
jgi:hypothetical protein